MSIFSLSLSTLTKEMLSLVKLLSDCSTKVYSKMLSLVSMSSISVISILKTNTSLNINGSLLTIPVLKTTWRFVAMSRSQLLSQPLAMSKSSSSPKKKRQRTQTFSCLHLSIQHFIKLQSEYFKAKICHLWMQAC